MRPGTPQPTLHTIRPDATLEVADLGVAVGIRRYARCCVGERERCPTMADRTPITSDNPISAMAIKPWHRWYRAADLRAGDVFAGHGTSFGRTVEAAGDAEPASDGRVRVPLVIDEFNTDPDIYFPAEHAVRLRN